MPAIIGKDTDHIRNFSYDGRQVKINFAPERTEKELMYRLKRYR